MYNLSVIDKARMDLNIEPMFFLDNQRREASQTKPYAGLKILHNVPLTLSTVFKIEVLALGGAEVVVYLAKGFPVENRAVDLLTKANFTVVSDMNVDSTFDFHLDCCAELIEFRSPRLGAVELTQSGSKIYERANLDYPIISVDDSKLKVLETFFGTGDGFMRALHDLVGDDKVDKPYVLFGYGKVGKGILYAISKFSHDITVIDLSSNFKDKNPGIKYIDAHDMAAVKEALARSYCTITATGIRHLLTDFYALSKRDFGNAMLVNMGAEDEYGPNFTTEDVKFAKKPFNFSLRIPTAFRYLDPIFYAHNCGIDLILAENVKKSYNPFPDELAVNILDRWQDIYNESTNEALLSF